MKLSLGIKKKIWFPIYN